MLSLLLTLTVAQVDCRFTSAWSLPVAVELHTARGDTLVTMYGGKNAVTADVVLKSASAMVTLHFDGWRVQGRVKSLPVTSTNPPQGFGHGYRPVETSLFEVTRSEGAEVLVTPWKLPHVTTKFRWVAQHASCGSLKLGGGIGAFCSNEDRVAISLTRGGEPAWRVSFTGLDVDDEGRTVATLVDGSIVTGWSKQSAGISGNACGGASCGAGTPKPVTCSKALTLFSRGGEEVGEVQAGSALIVGEKSVRFVEVAPDDSPFSGLLFVKRADFDSCGL